MVVQPTQRGFLVVELLIAVVVFALMMGGIFAVASGGQTMGLDVGLSKGGIGYAISSVSTTTQAASGLSGFNALADSTDSFDVYSGALDVSSVGECIKAIREDVGWGSEHNRTLSATLSTFIPSIELALELEDCDPFPPGGGWDAPSAAPIDDPIFTGSQASDIDVVRQGGNRYALLTTWKNPSPSGSNTLWVVNVTDLTASPMPFSAFATDGDLLAVDAIPGFAFVAGATTTGQYPFQVLDISDPTAVAFLVGVPLPDADTGNGRSIYYRGGMVYVGTQYLPCPSCAPEVNNEFHVFDVSDPSDPDYPEWKGSIDVQRDVNDIYVADGIAYLATSDEEELKIV
ncbi:MAG: prepilin-type N-terminal cleavage/methylation domain-containing protein, partial [Patescibacteria group bacterium]